MRGEKNPYEILEGAAKVLSAEHEKLKKEKKRKKNILSLSQAQKVEFMPQDRLMGLHVSCM